MTVIISVHLHLIKTKFLKFQKRQQKSEDEMQKLKSFWRSSSTISPPESNSQIKEESSLLQQASSYISSYRKQPIQLTTSQFDDYLQRIPDQFKRFKKNYLQKKSSQSYQSLKPQLVKRVYQKVQSQYFCDKFEISPLFFEKNKKSNREKQILIHESLDEVQVALFNQITARFDEILSVLRTVESLDCLVQYNIKRINTIRHTNMQVAKKAAQRQVKIVHLIEKKKNIEQSVKYMQKLKIYAQFIKKQQISTSTDGSGQKQSTSELYQSIQDIKKSVSFLGKLACCERLDVQIQATQQDLKKSFSQTLNELIFQYTVGKISPYRKSYWDKFRHKLDILQEQDKNKQQGTVILDQSTIAQDDSSHLDQAKLTLHPDSQNIVLKNIMRGWNQGQYAVGGLKSIIQKHIKSLHSKFLDDFRQFCESYLKNHEKQVSNPCLQDLLQQFNLPFFTKCCAYYSNLFQNVIYRLSSITAKSLNYIINVSLKVNQEGESQLSIDQKEKLTQMMDGILNVFSFVWKSIIDKFTEVFQSKQIVETYDISDFKAYIGVIQNLQDFFNKRVVVTLEYVKCPSESFLYQKFNQIKKTFPLSDISTFKKAKLLQYLSKMHKNAIQIQLKESLQNQIWAPTDIPTFYYDSLHYIITGQSLNLRRNRGLRSTNTSSMVGGHTMMYDTSVLMESMYKQQSFLGDRKSKMSSNFRIIRTQILIQNQAFKITQTILLLLEIIEDYMLLNQFYPQIQEQIALKISQMFRSYNASSLQLIVHAGAVVLGKIKTKSITAKHLALSTLCLRFCIFILECIKKRISLNDFQKLYKDIEDHAETTTKKLQTILKSKISQSAPEIKLDTSPSKGTEAIVNSCKILHDILIDFFDVKTLKKIFTKQIFTQYIARISALKVQNKVSAQTLKDDINFFFNELKFLSTLIEGFQQFRGSSQNVVRKAFQAL